MYVPLPNAHVGGIKDKIGRYRWYIETSDGHPEGGHHS